jgi:ATP-dependent Lon protease
MRYKAKEYSCAKSFANVLQILKDIRHTRYSNEIYKTANIPGAAVGLAWTYVGGDILLLKQF